MISLDDFVQLIELQQVSYIKYMKKKRLQANTRIYRISALPSPTANELRLKQIYNSAYKSRQKSPRSLRKNQLTRYQLPQTENKLQAQMQKTNRYRAYLQSQVIPKIKHNRRYSKKVDKQEQAENDKQTEGQQPVTSRTGRNQSVDMFKIRKSKVNSSHKVSASSYSRLQEGQNSEFEVAKTLYKQGKFSEALQIAEQCLQKQQKNHEYQYYTAIILLNLHSYEKGLELLQKVCRDHGDYKKTAYLFAAISAKNLNDLEKSYQMCTYGIQKYPNYSDLVMYRAGVSLLRGDFQKAHQDYEKIIKSDKNNVEVLIKNAQCLRKMGAYANCLSNLAAALYADNGQHKYQILSKRIEIYMQPQSYNLKQAKKDLSKLLGLTKQNPEIHYLKGIILSAEGFRKQSLLSFQHCLKQGTSKQIMCKALVEIVKNKINDRDFYSASYHINRSKFMELSSDQIQVYKLFSQGVVHLMKRKVAEGDKNFTTLLQKHPKLPIFLNKIFYLYRAFAKFSLSQYTQAIQSYEKAHKQAPLDIFAKYNKQLAQGIVQVQLKKYSKGFEYFNGAQKTISLANLNKIDPNLYRAASHIEQAKDLIKSQNDIEELKSLEEIFAGLKELDKAYDLNDSNSNMLYFRGLVYLYLGKFEEALQDIIKAISKSEENVAKYFFFRAITHSSLGNKKQALNDLNICCNLDEKYEMAYLERAKIHFFNQNVTKGLQDLIKLKNLNSKEDVKYHQACLNYFYGHYAMANACCDQIYDQQKAKNIKILIKTKLAKIKQAKKLSTSRADSMIFDIMLGKTDVQQPSSTDLQYFTLYHYHHYTGVKYFRLGDYQKSLDTFVMANKQRNLYDLQQGIASNSLIESQNQQENENQNDTDNDKDSIHRINFNIFLCYLQMREWKKAYEVFIRDVVGVKELFLKNQYVATLSHLLFQAIKETKYNIKRQDKQIYELNLYESKLDKSLSDIVIDLPNFILKTRLCLLGLTNPKLQQIYKTKANPDFILSTLKLSQIENRPEPPWVKREQSGLIFTDEVQNINIEFQTTENDQDDEENQDDEDEDDEEGEVAEDDEAQDQEEESNQQKEQAENKDQRISVRKFKEKMKLGDSIERKLQKIMEMKKKKSDI